MSIEKVVIIKIIGFDISKEPFENIIKLLNTQSNYNLKLDEDPCWGFQDSNLRINLVSNNKIEFMIAYETAEDLTKIKKAVKVFLDNTVLYFKAIAVSFSRLYTHETDIQYTYHTPVFLNDKNLKYKLHTEIESNEENTTLLTSNIHFYNFQEACKNSKIADVINDHIISKLEVYEKEFASSVGE